MARRRRTKQAVPAARSAEDEFRDELEIFRTEAETAAQFFYAYLAVHAAAGDDKAVYRLLNTAPLFWNTSLGGLQTAAIVTLGRIFDTNPATHNVSRLLRLAQDNSQIFSKAALARRKQGHASSPPAWLGEYLKSAYVPTPADFRRLRAHVRKHRKTYDDKYRDIRHLVFAHKGKIDAATLFAKTNIRELQRLLISLSALYEALWQLFENGARPVLRPRRYSVKRIRQKPSPQTRSQAVHERIIHEAEGFLAKAAGVSPKASKDPS